MSIDAHQIKEWAEATGSVITSVKAAIGLLPAGPKKEEAQRHLERAEFDFKRAQAESARQLGFELCPRCWPPEIILIAANDKKICRGCGKTPPESPGIWVA